MKKTVDLNEQTVRTALPLKNRLEDYDPTKSQMAYDWMLYHAIFSPLVEFDSNGDFISATANKFYWEGPKLIFEFRNDFRTVDGLALTASDAAFSLKRVIARGDNYHGDLAEILGISGLTSIDEDVPQIQVIDDKLVITPIRPTKFLLSMLSSLDFAVLPRSAFDGKSLDIIDFRNTSGPYYVESFERNMVLKANFKHWHYSPDMPQKIEISKDVRGRNQEPLSMSLFREGRLDLILPHGLPTVNEIEALSNADGVLLHRTLAAYVTAGIMTPKGRKRSPAERLFLAGEMQRSARHNGAGKHHEHIDQFLPPGSHGAFDEKFLSNFKMAQEAATGKINGRVVVAVSPVHVAACAKALAGVPFKLVVRPWKEGDFNFESYSGNSDEPDIVFVGQDISYEEDVALLGFSLRSGVFGLSKANGAQWLRKYIYEDVAAKRIEMVRQLQYRALVEDPSVVPMFISHYVAASRHGWQMNFPKTMAYAPFWKMRQH